MTTTIVVHLPAHRRRALQIERSTREAEQAYDAQIAAYLDFLRDEARRSGYELATDERDADAVFAITAGSGEQKHAAHDWLDTQPNWMP